MLSAICDLLVESDLPLVELTPAAGARADCVLRVLATPSRVEVHTWLFDSRRPDGRIWIEIYDKATKRDLPPRVTPSPAPRIYWYQDRVFDVFDPGGRSIPSTMELWPGLLALAVMLNLTELMLRKGKSLFARS